MSSEPPPGAYLARTLEPQEREQVEALRRTGTRRLSVVVGMVLAYVLALVLVTSKMGNPPPQWKIWMSVGVLGMGLVIWVLRRAMGRIASDLEQGAVHRLEGTLESKHERRHKRGLTYTLKIAGQRFDVAEKQFEAVQMGASCSIEFLPASRLALAVNDIRRWP